jgi:hypothetical protein
MVFCVGDGAMLRLIFAAAVLCFVVQGPASAAPDSEVQSKIMRCYQAEAKDELEDCVLAQPNVSPIDEFTKSGRSVLRAFLFDGEGRPRLFIQFIEKGGEATLIVRAPFSEQAIVERKISPQTWSGFLGKWANFDDALKQRNDERKRHEEDLARTGQEEVCIHSWRAIVESNIGKLPQIMVPDACEDQPGRFDLVNEMLAMAMQFAPECAALTTKYFGYDALRFNRCGDLRGDKIEAAAAMNRASLFSDPTDTSILDDELHKIVGENGTLEFLDGKKFEGPAPVVAAWRDATKTIRGYYADISQAVGAGDGVTVTGIVYGHGSDQPGYQMYSAPFKQLWRRDKDGSLMLESWNVGKFVPEGVR